MKFIGGNGDKAPDSPDALMQMYNSMLEQLCMLRADIHAMHGILQFIADKQGISIQKLHDLRHQLHAQGYERACADVLAQIRGEWPKEPPKK